MDSENSSVKIENIKQEAQEDTSLHDDWSKSLQNDAGWNRPYIDDAGLVPVRYKTLQSKLIDKHLVCNSGGNVYIFLPMLNKWSILCSDDSAVYMNSLMGMESASVNYDKALRPYIAFVERAATDNIASKIPTSICIGTNRLRVNRRGNEIILIKCEALLTQNPSYNEASAIASLCYMPLSIKYWPTVWERTDLHQMYNFIAPLFPNPIEMLTVEWTIGNCLLDPVASSKALILYGPGGTGKSTLLAAVKTCLMGCCSSIPDKALIGLSKGMNNAIASVVASSRVVTVGDVGGIDDCTNLAMIKTITGHDYISIPPLSARTSCSLFYATNRLDDPRKNIEWSTLAIMRRVVVVCMSVDALMYAENSMPQDSVSKLDFILRCVHTRLTYSSMPVSALSVVVTLTGSLSKEVLEYVVETSEAVTTEERSIVLSIVAAVLAIEPPMVCELADKISHSAVETIRGNLYLVGLKPTERYYECIESTDARGF